MKNLHMRTGSHNETHAQRRSRPADSRRWILPAVTWPCPVTDEELANCRRAFPEPGYEFSRAPRDGGMRIVAPSRNELEEIIAEGVVSYETYADGEPPASGPRITQEERERQIAQIMRRAVPLPR